ncbi:hypothetical protein Patl1_28480 [Pistacia atlantica]|uniref:Uncharacterized protein n=1 Tax=Pistacia atlantica TaxID=434234 RepID=A0ACC1BBX6_9ROSI|nr:hypothetical protein Patl1_28480 [Pistacia atlantica]
MDTATVPGRCTNWCYCKSASPSVTVKPTIQAATTAPGCVFACRKLDGVAAWLINGVAAVFFNTLERCSCINIGTIDDSDLDADADVPFIYNNNANLQLPKTEEGGGRGSPFKETLE